MRYIRYAEWNPLPLVDNALKTTAKRNRTHSDCHWDGGRTPKTAAESQSLLRAYDRHHRNSPEAVKNKRGGIAYGHAICPVTGDIYECRGFDRIHAAVGGKNTTDYSYIVIGGPGNFTAAARNGVRRLRQMEIEHFGRKLISTTHRRRVSTSCPGNDWDAWIMAGGPDTPMEPVDGETPAPRPTPAPAGNTAPPFPLRKGWYFGPRYPLWRVRSVSGFHGNRDHLRRWQQRMKDRGWHITVDGLYGPNTAFIAREFQAEKGLTVDGLIGPETWAAAWTEPVT